MSDENKTKTQLLDEVAKLRLLKKIEEQKTVKGRKLLDEVLKQLEGELLIKNRITAIFLAIPDDEMYTEVLRIILDVTKSEYGVFGHIDKRGDFVIPTMTRTIWDECQVPEKTLTFPHGTWGDSTWPRAIREKETICLNEPSTKTPRGHIAISRHISLPLIHLNQVVGLIQVANKKTDYTDDDLQLMKSIGQKIAPVLSARLERDAFAEEEKKLICEIAERVKELNCLYAVDKITSNESITKGEKFGEILDIILLGLQYPEFAYSRITLGNKIFKTRNFKKTKWVFAAEIRVKNRKAGLLEVFYQEKGSASHKGTFLKEERDLINSIAEKLGQFLSREQSEEEIRKFNQRLEQKIEERTVELKKMVRVMAGREVRMAGMKEVIKKLRTQLESNGMTPVTDDSVMKQGKGE